MGLVPNITSVYGRTKAHHSIHFPSIPIKVVPKTIIAPIQTPFSHQHLEFMCVSELKCFDLAPSILTQANGFLYQICNATYYVFDYVETSFLM